MRATDPTLHDLADRVGRGDHAAFRRLYAMLAPATLAEVRHELPDPAHSMHVVRATFGEIWWMCAFDVRCGIRRRDVAAWVRAVGERHCAERRQLIGLMSTNGTRSPQTPFWVGVIADLDESARCQLTEVLNGHDSGNGRVN